MAVPGLRLNVYRGGGRCPVGVSNQPLQCGRTRRKRKQRGKHNSAYRGLRPKRMQLVSGRQLNPPIIATIGMWGMPLRIFLDIFLYGNTL